jgi:type I restriction enzyme S subunit
MSEERKVKEKLPNGWKWTSLGEITKKISIKVLPVEYPYAKFIGMDCIQPHTLKPSFTYRFEEFKSSGNYFKTGQVLYGRMRPYLNKVYRAEYDGTCSGEFIVLQCHEWFNPDLLKYILHARDFVNFTNQKTSGDRPRISYEEIAEYSIALAPINEQQAIVSKIEELLSDLENGKQQLLTAQLQLKVYRQSLLKWAFEGKLTNNNVKDGELPEDWSIKKLSDIGTWKGGGTPSKSRRDFWENGNILWVSPKDMKSQLIKDTIDKITLVAIENSSTKLIPKGSVLFVVRSGILRRTLPIALTICEVTVNQDLQAFTPYKVLPEYIYWYVSARNDDIRKNCSKDGTTVESIESSLLKNYSIPICSDIEQQQIVQELESKLTVCDKIEETISQSLLQVDSLRQSILKNAFEGKLTK